MRGIVKTFPGVRALDGVDLVVRPGEVHCLLGQNGAGKSTLIKVLAGAHRPDEGEIRWQGEPVSPRAPRTARSPSASPRSTRSSTSSPGSRWPRTSSSGHERSRGGLVAAQRDPQGRPGAAGPPGSPGDPGRPRGRHAARLGPADREHGACPVPRHPADRDGRAVGGARPAGGADALPGDPRPHRPGRRRRLHLPPARGDPPGRRPGHRPQGRPHGRHRPRRPRTPRPPS